MSEALARRFGLVGTVVFTRIPSSACLIATAFRLGLEWALGLELVCSALFAGGAVDLHQAAPAGRPHTGLAGLPRPD